MVYMHGAPASIRQLAGALDMIEQQEAWQEYVADALCALHKAFRPKSTIRFYSELMSKGQADSRTGQEIVDDIIKNRRRKRRRKKAENETV